MMVPHLTEELKKEAVSDFHEQLLRECLEDVKRSRSRMSKNYSKWDMHDEVFRGERRLDEEDVKQAIKDKPTKMVVPNTFAQVMTFTSFLFLLFKQNATFFELKPTGSEDYGQKWEDSENILNRDWNRSNGSKNLFQFLLDVGRFGTGILETSWTEETTKIFVKPTPQDITQILAGVPLTAPAASAAEWKTFTKFEGNLIRSVSPYRWFPDPSFPISDFNKGNFCASEEDFTMAGLRKLEDDGLVAGVDFIQGLPKNLEATRGAITRMTFAIPHVWDASNRKSQVIVTKMRRWIIPKDFKMQDGKTLGEETWPVLYNIWYANDNRIIRCEPCEEWHQTFGYGVGQFTPDMHRDTWGLADLIYRLQDVISWFVNSHITSVRRVIQNRMIVNPDVIEMKSYDGEGDIFTKKGMGRQAAAQGVTQLAVQDVTGNHMTDVDILGKLMQMVTGVNDNFMGQMNSGRRSAQENRVQTAGAAGRMKMHGHLLWESGLAPIGRMMLSNSRQSLSMTSFGWALGGVKDPQMLQQRYLEFQGTPEEIVCGDDYLVFDATLSSEKGFAAQQLQELLSMIITANPMAAQQLTSRIDPAKIMAELQYLRDGTPIERFMYSPEEQAQQMQLQMAQMQAQQAQLKPSPEANPSFAA